LESLLENDPAKDNDRSVARYKGDSWQIGKTKERRGYVLHWFSAV